MTVLRVIKGGDWKLRIGRKTDKGEVGEPSDLASNPSLSFSDWLKPRFSDTRSLLVREGTHYYMEKAISFSRSNHITCHLHLLWLVTPRFQRVPANIHKLAVWWTFRMSNLWEECERRNWEFRRFFTFIFIRRPKGHLLLRQTTISSHEVCKLSYPSKIKPYRNKKKWFNSVNKIMFPEQITKYFWLATSPGSRWTETQQGRVISRDKSIT